MGKATALLGVLLFLAGCLGTSPAPASTSHATPAPSTGSNDAAGAPILGQASGETTPGSTPEGSAAPAKSPLTMERVAAAVDRLLAAEGHPFQ